MLMVMLIVKSMSMLNDGRRSFLVLHLAPPRASIPLRSSTSSSCGSTSLFYLHKIATLKTLRLSQVPTYRPSIYRAIFQASVPACAHIRTDERWVRKSPATFDCSKSLKRARKVSGPVRMGDTISYERKGGSVDLTTTQRLAPTAWTMAMTLP